jgi:hypothetical protein
MILNVLGGSLYGISMLGGIFFQGIPLYSQFKTKPLDYALPGQVLQKGNAMKRLQRTETLLTTRYKTSLPGALPYPFETNNMFGTRVVPKPSLTRAEASAMVDDEIPSTEIPKKSFIVEVPGDREYIVHLMTHKDKKIWHPFGNVITYNPGKVDVRKLLKHMKDYYPDYNLPEGYTVELDHALPDSFASAMGITRDEGAVVLVPGFSNGARTNNQELVIDNTNFDWMLTEEEQETLAKDGLSELAHKRLTDALIRNLLLYCRNTDHAKKLKTENPNIDFSVYMDAYNFIPFAYAEAYLHDMDCYHTGFGNKYNISGNKEPSLFAFYNELLLQGIKRDFDKAQLYSKSYFSKLAQEGNKIRPEYLISQVADTYIKQYMLSKQLLSLIPSERYKKSVNFQLDLQFGLYQDVIFALIKNSEDNPKFNFDIKVMQNELAKFKTTFENEKQKSIQQNNISKKDLYKKIFSKNKGVLSLGNFYKAYGTGENLNVHHNFASVQPKVVPGKPNVFFFKRDRDYEPMSDRPLSPYQQEKLDEIEKLGGKAPSFNIENKGENFISLPDVVQLRSLLEKIFGVNVSENDNPGDGGPGGGGPGDGGPGGGGPGGGGPGGGGPGGGGPGGGGPGGGGPGDGGPGDGGPGSDEPGSDEPGGGSKDKNPKRYGPPLLPRPSWKISAYNE